MIYIACFRYFDSLLFICSLLFPLRFSSLLLRHLTARNYLERPPAVHTPEISSSPIKPNATGIVIASNANAPPPVKPVYGRNSIAIDNVYVSDNDLLKVRKGRLGGSFRYVLFRCCC
jgi:hypothetical protein